VTESGQAAAFNMPPCRTPLEIGNEYELEIAAQGIAQCEVSATRVVVDVALRPIGKSRHGGHKIANISRDCERI